MWCPQCETQVAGIASPQGPSALVCAKCQTRLTGGASWERSPSAEVATGKTPATTVPLPGLRLDTYRMQTTLSRIDRLVQRLGEPADFTETSAPGQRGHSRGNTVSSSSASSNTAPGDASPAEAPYPADQPPVRPRGGFPWLATLCLSGGVMLLVCGCLLIVLSVLNHRPELFRIGFPITVIALACKALAACLYFYDASGQQAETQKWLADVQNQLGGIRQIAKESRHSLGSIPELPTTLTPTASEKLAQTEQRLGALRRRLNDVRTS